MLNIVQCQNPLPVGASGSYIVTAKLWVPAGSPDHDSAGEWFSPLQPKLLATCAGAIGPPFLTSGEVRVIPAAKAGAAAIAIPSPRSNSRVIPPPSVHCGNHAQIIRKMAEQGG